MQYAFNRKLVNKTCRIFRSLHFYHCSFDLSCEICEYWLHKYKRTLQLTCKYYAKLRFKALFVTLSWSSSVIFFLTSFICIKHCLFKIPYCNLGADSIICRLSSPLLSIHQTSMWMSELLNILTEWLHWKHDVIFSNLVS